LSGARFHRAKPKLAADTLELLAHVDDPGVEVDVGPAQAEDFTAPQAVEDQQHEGGVERDHGRPGYWCRAIAARRFFTFSWQATISLHACRPDARHSSDERCPGCNGHRNRHLRETAPPVSLL
jgi:hypothetical protein